MTGTKLTTLLTLAAEDLQLAKEPTTPARPAAYHLSQAAEKAARAICEYEGIQVGPTHNIGQIGALLPPDHPMREKVEAQNYQSSASTKYRYPDASGRLPQAPSKDDIQRRITDVSTFLEEVTQFVSPNNDDVPGGPKK